MSALLLSDDNARRAGEEGAGKTDALPRGLRRELALAQSKSGRLTFTLYDRAGSRVLVLAPGNGWVLGREGGADVRLDERGVSAAHALLSVSDDGPHIEDLGSKNGTWVNGARVERRPLFPGDRVGLGAAHGVVASLAGEDRGLTRHDAFISRLEEEIARARKRGRPLCVAMLEAEPGAKSHAAFWASRVGDGLERYDLAASYASNCIELLLPEVDPLSARARLDTLVARAKPTRVRASLCAFPRDGRDADELIYGLRRGLGAVRADDARGGLPFLAPARWLPASLQQALMRLAPFRTTLLIIGETGTGKERWARELHRLGPRSDEPFVCLNCAAIPDELVESTFFGHIAGAFTGAACDADGVFEEAGAGTLLLDGVEALSPRAQGVLLEVLESRRFRPVGASSDKESRARVVATTNKDLEKLVAQRRFRADLRYRLGAAPVELPPLRGRRALVAELAEHFAHVSARDNGVAVPTIPVAAMELLCEHHWPGNMRELRNVVERGALLAEAGEIRVDDLPAWVAQRGDAHVDEAPFKERVERFERALIIDALRATRWNQSDAARALGMPRRTLVHKLKSLGIREMLPGAGDP